MDRAGLAAQLWAAPAADRAELLAQYPDLADRALAWELKSCFDDLESSDATGAMAAAAALDQLAARLDHDEITALARWTSGMAELMNGQMERAIDLLDEANERFTALGLPERAAATAVSQLFALAVLGRYDEAITTGLGARDLFVAAGDTLTAGKLEQNLGNIYFRRDQYAEAEDYYRSARERFLALDDTKQLAQIDNCLATALTSQHRFAAAVPLYEAALARASEAGLGITEAEIECNLGALWLFQGRYDRALHYLEQSRRRYAAMGLPHESAYSEQELADAYLDLNLAREAAAIYSRIAPVFEELAMQAELAHCYAYWGRARMMLGETAPALELLTRAHELYRAEGNEVGAATALLIRAQLLLPADPSAAAALAEGAEAALVEAGARGRVLFLRWLRGEAARLEGRTDDATALLVAVLRQALDEPAPQVALRCQTSLGLLALAAADDRSAEQHFKASVALIEDLRAPLPTDEFRSAFLGDKLRPYAELVRLCLRDGGGARVVEALQYVEQSRSRALVDMMSGALPSGRAPQDPAEAELLRALEEQRAELNWLYSQLGRSGETGRSGGTEAGFYRAVREREATLLEVWRKLRQHDERMILGVEPVEIAWLQAALGSESVLVEYFELDGELLAFVVSDTGVHVVEGLCSQAVVERALKQFDFHLGALEHGAPNMRGHLPQLTARIRHHLAALYDLLMRPLEPYLGARRLIVVPHRILHYVPFHALHDGVGYVLQQREVSYAPSAGVLGYCLGAPRRPIRRPLLIGVPDALTPHVLDEVLALAPLFPDSVTLLGEQATLGALASSVTHAGMLHMACHGQFRPDSPLFSALRLADGWLTVYDTLNLSLNCELVTLSACETGVNSIAPGDELIGLARGFFAAGVPSLLVSLWTADDEATARLMTLFYERVQQGERIGSALRSAQLELLAAYEHPFFWAPFVLLGRS